MKRKGFLYTVKKSVWDIVVCTGLIFPDLFPGVPFGAGISTAFVVAFGFVIILHFTILPSLFIVREKKGHCFTKEQCDRVDGWFRVYEPLSDLALMVCLVISGHPILSGISLFSGVISRGLLYKDLEEYREKGEQNGSENN